MTLTGEELLTLFTHLEGCARAEIPMTDALAHAPSGAGRRFKRLWPRLSTAVNQGLPLSEALSAAVPHLEKSTIAMVRAGETNGHLAETLGFLVKTQSRGLRLNRVICMTLIQPALALTVGLLVLIFVGFQLGGVVGPGGLARRYLDIFAQLGAELPRITVFALEIARFIHPGRCLVFMSSPAGITISALIIAIMAGFLVLRPWRRPRLRRAILRWIPGIAPPLVMAANVRWCHTMGHLLGTRIPIVRALALAEATLNDPRLERAAQHVQRAVEGGCPLAAALANTNLLPGASTALLLHAEMQGRVPEMLLRLSDHLQDRLQGRMDSMESWLEPILTCFVGGWVLVIALGMYFLLNIMIMGIWTALFTVPIVLG